MDLEHQSDMGADSSGLSREVLKMQFRHILAEMNMIQETPLSKLSETCEVNYDSLVSDLEEDIVQLKEKAVFVTGQNGELDNLIKNKEDYSEQHCCVNEALDKRLQEIEESGGDKNISLEKHKEDIYKKTKNGEKEFKNMMKQLGKFVDTHFPLPSEETFNDVKKKLRSADRNMTHHSMISLKRILEQLMNKCIDEPSDPYVLIDHRFWPPYVELLLRCRIALRHPDDEQRIKLVPFHL